MGMSGRSAQLFATGIYGCVKTLTCACFLLFAADSLGRRTSLLWTSIGQFLALFVVGFYLRQYPPSQVTSLPPVGYFAMVCIFLWVSFFQFGWGPCCWIYVSEIPSARLRATNVAAGAATQWFFNFLVARVFLNQLNTLGYGVFLLYGSFCFLMFFFVWFYIPETKGLSLEKMDDLFGVANPEKARVGDEEREVHQATEIKEG